MKFLNPKIIYRYYKTGKNFINNPFYIDAQNKNKLEIQKKPSRTDIINFSLSLLNRETTYLEIGVRNPQDNFNHIQATTKYSVDPGVEFKSNPVDFKMTSDDFFKKLRNKEVLSPDIKFDVIFIDGLHLAEQVDKDIKNAINFIKEDGFIILHDCNPPTEWHARTEYSYYNTPALGSWNGTTWKAFVKARFNPKIQSCCIDSDWGVGILSLKQSIGKSIDKTNEFYEYDELNLNRKETLNLVTFNDYKKLFNK